MLSAFAYDLDNVKILTCGKVLKGHSTKFCFAKEFFLKIRTMTDNLERRLLTVSHINTELRKQKELRRLLYLYD